MKAEIDTTNKFMVGSQGHSVRILRPPSGLLTREDALNLAAWIVALADMDDEFPAVLEAVQNT